MVAAAAVVRLQGRVAAARLQGRVAAEVEEAEEEPQQEEGCKTCYRAMRQQSRSQDGRGRCVLT